MIYLVIMFLVAGTGLASLWVQQRRARAHLESVDGFRTSLQKLSTVPVPRRRVPAQRQTAAPRRVSAQAPVRRGAPAGHRSSRRSMDPVRRAAARKRIEARRRAAARSRAF